MKVVFKQKLPSFFVLSRYVFELLVWRFQMEINKMCIRDSLKAEKIYKKEEIYESE